MWYGTFRSRSDVKLSVGAARLPRTAIKADDSKATTHPTAIHIASLIVVIPHCCTTAWTFNHGAMVPFVITNTTCL